MVYSRNTVYIFKVKKKGIFQKNILIPGVWSRFGGFLGDPRRVSGGPSGIVVGSVVSVVVDSARSERMQATSGKMTGRLRRVRGA